MSKKRVGRNDPCPCGSGRKYKKCCLRRETQASGFTADERASALRRLQDYLHHAAPEWIKEAAEAFWGPYLERAEELDESLRMMSQAVFELWLFFDYRAADDRRLVDHFLESCPVLTGGERRYLKQARATAMRLYEIVEVRPGAGMTVRDLVQGDEVRVRERLGSRQFHNWDLLAARVMPAGASGEPELDSGLFVLPRFMREDLLGKLEADLAVFREDCPGADELEFFEVEAPLFHQWWLQPALEPRLPQVMTPEGEEIRLTQVFFDVLDEARLIATLDASGAFERDQGELAWCWPGAQTSMSLPGSLRIRGHRLILETLSAEQGERGRALVEQIAGNAVHPRLTSYQDLAQALADFDPEASSHKAWESTPGEADEEIAGLYERHFRAWLDEEIPALEGSTPRAAARSPLLRPRLIEMLKDLEHEYERALSMGQPGFDPSWMWAELDLGNAAEAPAQRQRPPLTGFESMELRIPGIGNLAREIAGRYAASTTLTQRLLAADLPFSRFLLHQAVEARNAGSDPEAAPAHANLIAGHLEYMCNYELHRRKTFWVEDALAWMLGHTQLDVTGDLLRLPFPSFAVIFNDRYTLGLAERMLSLDPECELRGRMLRIVTAYVTEVPAEPPARGVKVAFTFDALAGQWPYLLTRDLWLEPDEPLEAILDSHFPDIDVEAQDPLFSSLPLKRLLHLLINAILYATSAGVEPQVRPAPVSEWARARASSEGFLSSEEVYYLPGKISISHLRQMQTVERAPSGRKLMHRFMVRGHWRRANRSWKDQRPRWIRPYWKGPEIGAIIERAYQMKP